MFKFNEIEETSFNLTVKNIKKSVLPVIENRFVRRTAADGSFNFGSSLGNSVIEVTFQDKVSQTKKALYTNMLNIAAWLYPLDKLEKKIEILDGTNYMGENGLFRYGKVDGSTDLEEILSYGVFTATFICSNPHKLGVESSFLTGLAFSRNSNAWQDINEVGNNVPRFYPVNSVTGLMVETGATNFVFNSMFINPVADIPEQYGASVLDSTGTHSTIDGIYRAEMLTSTSDGAFFGIKEPGGSQHLIPLTTDLISTGIYAQVISGTALARMILYYLDTSYNSLPSLSITTSSTSRIRIVLESQNQATQKVIGFSCDAYATTTGDVGIVEFSKPMMEINNFAHTFHDQYTPRVNESAFMILDPLGFVSATPMYMAVTVNPNWGKTDLQGDAVDRVVLALVYDANNYIKINWNATLEQFEANVDVIGVTTTAVAPSQSFVAGDMIKLYLLKEATRFKLYLRINSTAIVSSAYTADARPNPPAQTLYIGSDITGNQINGVITNVIFDDQDLAPDPLNYL